MGSTEGHSARRCTPKKKKERKVERKRGMNSKEKETECTWNIHNRPIVNVLPLVLKSLEGEVLCEMEGVEWCEQGIWCTLGAAIFAVKVGLESIEMHGSQEMHRCVWVSVLGLRTSGLRLPPRVVSRRP